MDFLPEEILENIFTNLSPYNQCQNASIVCKRWHRIINGLTERNIPKFEKNCKKGKIKWSEVKFGSQITNVTPRMGQSMCYNDYTRSVYIFGGRSLNNSHTGFNDLLRLDMDTLTWHRPLIKGDVMAPKFGCAFQSYKNYLLIFGGSSLPPTNTLGRGRDEFNNDLHIYDTTTGILTHKSFLQQECPPELYLPTTCVIQDDLDPENDIMVVYGGRKKRGSKYINNNELWCLNWNNFTWQKQSLVGGPSPQSFNATAKGMMVKFEHSSNSSAILVLSQTPKINKAWLLVKTGPAEWTWQLLSFANELDNFDRYFQSMYTFNDVPYVLVGKTLVLFSLHYDSIHMPGLNDAAPIKLLSMDKNETNASKSITKPRNNAKNVLQNNNENSPLYMYMLDLSNIERNGELKWVDQMSPNSNILMSNFLVNNVPRRLKVVLGRNEIILLGSEKNNMSLYLVN